jgi:hypothetical protein
MRRSLFYRSSMACETRLGNSLFKWLRRSYALQAIALLAETAA